MRKAIAIDFDGCLCSNAYPEIGEPNWPVIRRALAEQKAGAGLILWTCREGNLLQEAVAACEGWGLAFDAVNESLPDWIEEFGNRPRKVGASEYWDDKAVKPITLGGTYVSMEWFNKVKVELDACKAELQAKGSCETCIRYETHEQCPMAYGFSSEECLRERLCGCHDCQDGSKWIWRGNADKMTDTGGRADE